MWSRSRVQGVHKPYCHNVSPILAGPRQAKSVSRLRGRICSGQEYDCQVIEYLIKEGKNPTNKDGLDLGFYRRWAHPVMVFDNTRYSKSVFPPISHHENMLNELANHYFRFTGYSFTIENFNASSSFYGRDKF